MRAMEAFALAACGAVLLCTLAAPAAPQFFAPVPVPVADLSSPLAYGPAVAPAYFREPAPAFQLPAQPTDGQHSAAAFFAGAAVVAAVCCRVRAPSAVAMAAVDGQEVLSRRAMLAALAASPVFAATAAHAAKPIWAVRKDGIQKPMSVAVNKCNVEKPCKADASFPFSDRSNKRATQIQEQALNKYKARNPQPKEE